MSGFNSRNTPPLREWDTEVGHKGPTEFYVERSKASEKTSEQWVTGLGHKSCYRGLYRRGMTYQLRVRVPADIRSIIASSHLKRSLRTDSLRAAVRLSRIVAAEFEAVFERARRDAGQNCDYRLLAADCDEIIESQPSVGDRANVSQKSPVTLAETYDRFVDDPTKRRAARTRLAHVTTRRVIEELLGPDTPLVQITRDDCRSVLDTLRFLPVNHSKMAAGMTVQKAVDFARSDPATRTINSTNLNAYMARFSAMMNWAVSEEIIERNPARGLQVAHSIQPRDRRKPFNGAQLRAIFRAPIYTGCRDERYGYAEKGEAIASGARFWVPLIGLWTGMSVQGGDKTSHRNAGGLLSVAE